MRLHPRLPVLYSEPVEIMKSLTAVTGSTWRATTPATHTHCAAVNAPADATRHANAFTYANKYGSSGTWSTIG
jgi:hypothetical protein